MRITLNSEIETALCRACLLEPEALPTSFQVAQAAFDTRRNGMGFGVGTEGGFGHWIVLTHPMPCGHLSPQSHPTTP